ncbi:MAG: efflux RND transporter permease subunit [Thermoguttaceae bacterium]
MKLIVFALRHPITILVGVVGIVLAACLATQRMSVDIFPEMDMPVINVVQPYGGMDPEQMEGYLTNYTEFLFLLISGIHHVESKNIQSIALTKLYFHPGTDMRQALAETVNYINRARAFMPPGTVPPIVLRYDAGSVPVGFLVFSSDSKNVGQIQDEATFRVRPMLSSLRGVSAPPSFGGEARTILIRVDPRQLRSLRLSPDDLVAALVNGNQVSPSGRATIADKAHIVSVNAVVTDIKDLGKIPIRTGASAPVYLRDIAAISDSTDLDAGYALVNGRRSVFLPITKRPDASTLDVVNLVKANLSRMQAALSEDVQVRFEFDQSPYVTHAMSDVAKEGVLGALLTGLMVLLFLRDWRSVLVVVITIPLALMASLVALWLARQTINIMTLGGLALAVGILVDEAVVVVENIHARMQTASSVAQAVWQGTMETAVPCLLAMMCILAVFLPALFMQGAVRALFIPLALAVGFAMVASYVLSTTFVPVLATWILRPVHDAPPAVQPIRSAGAEKWEAEGEGRGRKPRLLVRLAGIYPALLVPIVRRQRLVIGAYLAVALLVIVVAGGRLGREIFPVVDAGQFQLRLRAPPGTTLESMEELTRDVLDAIGREAGPENVDVSIALVGTASNNFPINFIYMWTSGPQETLMRVSFKRGSGVRIEELKERLRQNLPALARRRGPSMKDVALSFEAGDIVAEVMSFGSPTPVEVVVSGSDLAQDRDYAGKIRAAMAGIESLRDLQFGQTLDYPAIRVDVDRQRAGLSGISVRDVSRSLVAATYSSRYVVPNFWRDPASGIGYQVEVEVPPARMDSVKEVEMMPLRATADGQVCLRDVAQVRVGTMPGEYDRYNMRRLISVQADIHGQDLGTVSQRVTQAVRSAGEPPRGVSVDVRGQTVPMQEMFGGLSTGLILTVAVVFLLLMAYFQSPALALAVTATVPAAMAGAALGLVAWGTTLNIQSFMGTIMAIGVALANSILLVTFAEQARRRGASAADAAREGAQSRLRPILMTSCAMLAGMLPMALALGEGGQQTAPLGRAVIGGLACATLATLFVTPAVFALLRSGAGRQSASLDPNDPDSPRHDPSGNGRADSGALSVV